MLVLRSCQPAAAWAASTRTYITATSLAKVKEATSKHAAGLIPPHPRKNTIPIYAPLPGPATKDAMAKVHLDLKQQYDTTGERTLALSRRNLQGLRPGMVLSVFAYNNFPALSPVSTFSGYLIGIKRAGIESSLRLRTQVMRIGVEMRVPVYAPTIKEIRVIKREPPKKIRRAKLFYMRSGRHDKGAPDAIVKADRERREQAAREAKRQERR
ncbi:translation protein SH3-like domain-containing protein [Protomyces lactucae-debilis]|uniref:Translation protein SH3-like domain-containing protein n=1 Tax=Protomyces lactucae-debilis TaxID=2754530 RepID=A0A1Y2FT12_PROLT|nr:translation protein SH3-like domain-containing protein [Protomyces lactucae-debilis]ORY87079.1 translation protein SH3-like domain-containing protein [Protomyces lactucae-debilis]